MLDINLISLLQLLWIVRWIAFIVFIQTERIWKAVLFEYITLAQLFKLESYIYVKKDTYRTKVSQDNAII